MVERLDVGASYRVVEPISLGRWCVCDAALCAGDVVTVVSQPSPNRVIVGTTGDGRHKARASTLRMIVEPI